MDKIILKGVEFYGYHGVLESEKELGQMFSVDCELSLDTSLAGDEILKTIHYGEVALDIVRFSTTNRFDLLETLANRLASHLLIRYPLADKIKITVHKPHAPIPTKFEDVSLTVERGWITAYIGLGSNLGDQRANIQIFIDQVEESEEVQQITLSSFIETEPYGVLDQPNFLNGAMKIRTILTPIELLRFCQKAEQAAGRVKKRHWGERTLDVDILMYGNVVIFTDDLKIPHPEMHLREFVLKPLVEIEPYLINSLRGKNMTELLKENEMCRKCK